MRQLTALSIRFVAAFLALSSINALGTVLPMVFMMPEDYTSRVYSMLAAPTVLAIVWIFVFIFADRLSAIIGRQPGDEIQKVEFDGATAARVGTALLGLYLIVTSIPGLALYILQPEIVYLGDNSEFLLASRNAKVLSGLIVSVCGATLGAALLIFARRIGRIIHRS